MCSGLSKALVLISIAVVFCRNNNDVQNIARAVNKFGDELYKELAKHSGNIVFSPFSVHSILALLTLGAGGRTKRELLSELFLTNTEILENGYSIILEGLHDKIEQNPRISTAIVISENYLLRESFKIIAKSVFRTILQKVNFERPTQAAAAINKLIESETEGAIPAIVNEKSFYDETTILLLNAIYFKGKWSLKFDKSKTAKDFVFNAPGKEIKCNMMVMEGHKHNVIFTPNFTYLELSFDNTGVKIAFISPYDGNVTSLERILNETTLFKERNNLRSTLLDLKIPKFNLSARYSLKKALISIGVSDIFDSPNLSDLFENLELTKVDEVDQKTVVEINEDGAIAASVSKLQLVARSTEIAQQVVLDRPFLFFLYDSNYNIILIRGRVENPLGDVP